MPIKIVKKGRGKLQTSAKPSNPSIVAKGRDHPSQEARLIRDLGADRMPQINDMIVNNKSDVFIAKVIKNDWGLMLSTNLMTVKKAIFRYRTEVYEVKLTYAASPDAKKIAKFAERADVLENLTTLVELQQGRVSKGLALEEKSPHLHYMLKFEIQLLGNLHKQLTDLQMDLGLLRKVPAKFQVEGMATRSQQLLEDAMKKSERVDAALTKAFAVLDGKYKVVADRGSPPKH